MQENSMQYTCRICKTENLYVEDMKWNRHIPDRCKNCWNNMMRQYRKDNPEKFKLTRNKRMENKLKYEYGITIDQYNKLLDLQLGGCAICKQPCNTHERLSIDHNHKTNEVRGLLCQTCNTALGMLNEDEDLIWNMLEYLKRTTWNVKEEKHYDVINARE